MSVKWHILVVDDDPEMATLIADYLAKYGYRVSIAKDGIEMDRQLKQFTIDVIILDVMLPGEDGVSICRRLRETSDVLIIMLSALGDETDRVVGLEVGADDYIAKPFGPRELVARIKSLERRTRGPLAEQRQKGNLARLPNLKFSDWLLDQNKRRLIDKDQVTIPLSAAEYELLQAFVAHPHRVLTRDQLLDLTKGDTLSPFDRTIDVQVGRLRKKIEVDPKQPKIIVTVRGGGYQFDVDVTPYMEDE